VDEWKSESDAAASGRRDCILGTHRQKVSIDALQLGDEDHDAEITVAGNEDHFVAALQFLQNFEARERATALPFQVLNAVARFDHDQVAVQVGLVRFIGADIEEPLLNQLANLRGGNDAAGNLGITKDEHGSPPAGQTEENAGDTYGCGARCGH